ncbi:RHS repeat-associated core domain-containing protein, partial [Pantoea sp. B65]|uniref:RHS repeat-associated core domain-containing protein n=1 Tax=Pantoea sp. B65 TaxID=2813359 RepID=UPI0039B55D7C
MRISKVSRRQSGNSLQTQRVTYLPGLERHTSHTGETLKAELHTLTAGEAGAAQVRLLHWHSGLPAGISNNSLRYSYDNLTGSSGLEVDAQGELISQEEYYPYGGTAIRTARSQAEAEYKTRRYSGKERDASGLYYYGYRYYQCWAGRWLSADPAGATDGLNLYQMVRNNPVSYRDPNGLVRIRWHPDTDQRLFQESIFPKAKLHLSNILSQNLTHMYKRNYTQGLMVENAITNAKKTLEYALFMAENHPAETAKILEPFIGKAEPVPFSSIVRVWKETHNALEIFDLPHIKKSRIVQFSNSRRFPGAVAQAISDEGAVIIFEEFFNYTQNQRTMTMIHEFSHMETVTDTRIGLHFTGAGTYDSWYLGGSTHEENSQEVLAMGTHAKSINYFFDIEEIADNVRAITGQTLTDAESAELFNKYIYYRQSSAARNPDTVGWAAIKVARARYNYSFRDF